MCHLFTRSPELVEAVRVKGWKVCKFHSVNRSSCGGEKKKSRYQIINHEGFGGLACCSDSQTNQPLILILIQTLSKSQFEVYLRYPAGLEKRWILRVIRTKHLSISITPLRCIYSKKYATMSRCSHHFLRFSISSLHGLSDVCHGRHDAFVLKFIWMAVDTTCGLSIWTRFYLDLGFGLDGPGLPNKTRPTKKKEKKSPPRFSLCFSSRLWLIPTGGPGWEQAERNDFFFSLLAKIWINTFPSVNI